MYASHTYISERERERERKRERERERMQNITDLDERLNVATPVFDEMLAVHDSVFFQFCALEEANVLVRPYRWDACSKER